MKKVFLSFGAFFLLTILLSSQHVFAQNCSGWQGNPYMYQVSPDVKSPTFKLKTEASACKGANTAVYFGAFRSLPDSYQIHNPVIWVDLYEEDPPGNADEHVKAYAVRYFNRVVSDVVITDVYETGNIDSEGDQTCELYLTFVISGECCYIPFQATIFDYNVCMN